MSANTIQAAPGLLRQVCRWKPTGETLAEPARFAARVMTSGTWSDVQTGWRRAGEEWFRAALRQAPPGVFDARSWVCRQNV